MANQQWFAIFFTQAEVVVGVAGVAWNLGMETDTEPIYQFTALAGLLPDTHHWYCDDSNGHRAHSNECHRYRRGSCHFLNKDYFPEPGSQLVV